MVYAELRVTIFLTVAKWWSLSNKLKIIFISLNLFSLMLAQTSWIRLLSFHNSQVLPRPAIDLLINLKTKPVVLQRLIGEIFIQTFLLQFHHFLSFLVSITNFAQISKLPFRTPCGFLHFHRMCPRELTNLKYK